MSEPEPAIPGSDNNHWTIRGIDFSERRNQLVALAFGAMMVAIVVLASLLAQSAKDPSVSVSFLKPTSSTPTTIVTPTTVFPSHIPSPIPSNLPRTSHPSQAPSKPLFNFKSPSGEETLRPSVLSAPQEPSSRPTGTPSTLRSAQPSPSPTTSPSVNPTLNPSAFPTSQPPNTAAPSPLSVQSSASRPSTKPTTLPTTLPTFLPTDVPFSPALVVPPPSSPPIGPMVQLGNDIDGDAAFDEAGSSVALSSDGTTLAVGAWRNSKSGRVKVYTFSRGNWGQLGGNLDGQGNDSRFGRSLALSADGTVLAVGAEQHDKSSAEFYVGRAEIFAWNGGSWVRRGSPIDGKGEDDYFGAAIDLSNDGTVLVVGANSYQTPGSVGIYEWTNAEWQQRGVGLEGTSPNDSFGYAVSISSDGSVVAIGARANDNDNGSDAGQVRIFRWNGVSWDQRGVAINGERRDDFFGNSVALSGDGNTVAIGASLGNYCKVFRFDEDWTPLGQTISGEGFLDRFGTSVSLSSSGDILIVGAIWHGSSGSVFVYHLAPDRTSWMKVGKQVGESPDDNSGASVAMSRDAFIVAIGAPQNDGVNGENSGQVRVFRILQ